MEGDAPSNVLVRHMREDDAAQVAALHADTITEGFLTRLGRRFLRQLYLGIARDPQSAVFVAEQDGSVAGFCAYSRDVSAMYRRVLGTCWARLAWAALPAALSPRVLREVFETLRYPRKQAALRLPRPEILSIGVSSAARGGGVGRRLVEAAVDRARADSEQQLKVLAGAKLEAANRFYQRCGFECVTTLVQHGEPLNVYSRRL